MTTISTYGVGYSSTAPTEAQAFIRRSTYAANATKIGVIAGHSGGATAATGGFATSGISTAYPRLMRWLAECGWPVLITDLAGDPTGNDTSSARNEESRTFLQASPQSAKSGKVILLGWSEGGLNSMKYALDHPTNVAAMILLQPASDLQDIVTNNRGGFASLVNAAYSGGYSDATYGAAHNPVLFAPTLAASNIPTWMAYATDDATVIPSTVASVVSSLGSSCTVGLTSTGGHGDGFLNKLLAADGSCGAISNWLNGLGL